MEQFNIFIKYSDSVCFCGCGENIDHRSSITSVLTVFNRVCFSIGSSCLVDWLHVCFYHSWTLTSLMTVVETTDSVRSSVEYHWMTGREMSCLYLNIQNNKQSTTALFKILDICLLIHAMKHMKWHCGLTVIMLYCYNLRCPDHTAKGNVAETDVT